MKDKQFDGYFIDITFKIMPKKLRSNKMVIIATIDKINNKTIINVLLYLNIWIINPIIIYLNI